MSLEYDTLLSDILKCQFIENLDSLRIQFMRRLTLTEKHKLLFAMVYCYQFPKLNEIAHKLNGLNILEKISFIEDQPQNSHMNNKPEKDIHQLVVESEGGVALAKRAECFLALLGKKNVNGEDIYKTYYASNLINPMALSLASAVHDPDPIPHQLLPVFLETDLLNYKVLGTPSNSVENNAAMTATTATNHTNSSIELIDEMDIYATIRLNKPAMTETAEKRNDMQRKAVEDVRLAMQKNARERENAAKPLSSSSTPAADSSKKDDKKDEKKDLKK